MFISYVAGDVQLKNDYGENKGRITLDLFLTVPGSTQPLPMRSVWKQREGRESQGGEKGGGGGAGGGPALQSASDARDLLVTTLCTKAGILVCWSCF